MVHTLAGTQVTIYFSGSYSSDHHDFYRFSLEDRKLTLFCTFKSNRFNPMNSNGSYTPVH